MLAVEVTYLVKQPFKQIGRWIRNRLSRLPERDRHSSFWFILIYLFATSIAAVVTAIGNPTGTSAFSRAVDIGKALGLNLLAFAVVTIILAMILSLIYIPLPRLAASAWLYTIGISITILNKADSGPLFSWIVGTGYGLVVSLFGCLVLLFIQRRKGRVTLLGLVIAVALFVGIFKIYDDFLKTDSQTMPVATEQESLVDDPTEHGDYDVTFMTYGSGKDVQREAFGAKIDEVTSSVDASSEITSWGEKREDFWGFGPADLPVNGRVWKPDGDGPFPVILIAHGNHTMENFSTDGYDYLGKLLASRGFLAISVDEDFINYSNHLGQPNDNYQLRAWMMLQHLITLKHMNQSPESAFYQTLDMENVALVGHSRGGQAAPMAADYDSFFDDDALLAEMEDISIKAVAALAPTDKSIDGDKPDLHNTSYLVLQGARDADISDFRGDRQYERTTFDPDGDGFKTSLYIAGANHTQFNTSWGSLDLSFPRGVFLNRSETMDASEQRTIAKGYLSAFFERVFHSESAYDQLFKDYRYGADWLPDTTLINKYSNGNDRTIQDFDVDDDHTGDASDFKTQEITTPLDRAGNKRLKDALRLEWDEDAYYDINVAEDELVTATGRDADDVVLTMANIDGKDMNRSDIDMALVTTDGRSVTLPLNHFMPLPPVVETTYTSFGFMDDSFREGKYEEDWEPVFQTIHVPVEDYEQADPTFHKEDIAKMRLHFKSNPGAILLEEVRVQ